MNLNQAYFYLNILRVTVMQNLGDGDDFPMNLYIILMYSEICYEITTKLAALKHL